MIDIAPKEDMVNMPISKICTANVCVFSKTHVIGCIIDITNLWCLDPCVHGMERQDSFYEADPCKSALRRLDIFPDALTPVRREMREAF